MTIPNSARQMAAFLSALALLAAPAGAHEKPHRKQTATPDQMVQPPQPGQPIATVTDPKATHAQMGEMMGEKEDRSQMSVTERLLDWLGRLHPTIVHFPIAFFPAALFTAIVGRRRPAFAAPVRFLVVTGGIIAPIAAVLGWLDAIGAEPGSLLTVHRWLGTAIGVVGLGLGVWAWRRPAENRGTGMIVGLTLVTAAVVAQGWFGGALVHGMDHMNW